MKKPPSISNTPRPTDRNTADARRYNNKFRNLPLSGILSHIHWVRICAIAQVDGSPLPLPCRRALNARKSSGGRGIQLAISAILLISLHTRGSCSMKVLVQYEGETVITCPVSWLSDQLTGTTQVLSESTVFHVSAEFLQGRQLYGLCPMDTVQN